MVSISFRGQLGTTNTVALVSMEKLDLTEVAVADLATDEFQGATVPLPTSRAFPWYRPMDGLLPGWIGE